MLHQQSGKLETRSTPYISIGFPLPFERVPKKDLKLEDSSTVAITTHTSARYN